MARQKRSLKAIKNDIESTKAYKLVYNKGYRTGQKKVKVAFDEGYASGYQDGVEETTKVTVETARPDAIKEVHKKLDEQLAAIKTKKASEKGDEFWNRVIEGFKKFLSPE